ncbi:MAG: hypothetical protein QOG46_1721, partial [Pseudonocardiales bacterium]|nr:hypothetical protein [Pseudonocardiales bacterium]
NTNPENTDRRTRTVEAVNEADRELLMLLGSVGIRVGEMVTGLFEDSLSCDEQLAFGNQLCELGEGFRERVHRTPLVIDGEAT